MKKYLFLSVKQEYAEKILEGSKTIELRKSKPNVSPGDYIIIYCTSPIKAIVGVATIQQVIIHSPQRMWQLYSKTLGIEKGDYLSYYGNSEKAIGIVLGKVVKLSDKIYLDAIKQQLPTFTPPQTYKYFMDFHLSKKDKKFDLVPFA
jgi:predicted transcriptional regulator